ncbi:hypothetical protein O5269_28500, partial [Escherichia coli]|nr:hypothetical protein [Escherichia coli]
GESRLFYHGIQPLKAGFHPLTTDPLRKSWLTWYASGH